MDEFPTVVEGDDGVANAKPDAPLFDTDLEAADEHEDLQMWGDNEALAAPTLPDAESPATAVGGGDEELPLELEVPEESQEEGVDDEDVDIDPSLLETVKDFGGALAGAEASDDGYDSMLTIHDDPLISGPSSDVEETAASEESGSTGFSSDGGDVEEPAVEFDVDQEESDEEDDALLWADDEENGPSGDLTLEAPAEEPSPTPLPSLEEYQPLNDSDASLLDPTAASEGSEASEGFDADLSSFEVPPDDSEFNGLEDDKPQN